VEPLFVSLNFPYNSLCINPILCTIFTYLFTISLTRAEHKNLESYSMYYWLLVESIVFCTAIIA